MSEELIYKLTNALTSANLTIDDIERQSKWLHKRIDRAVDELSGHIVDGMTPHDVAQIIHILLGKAV